MNSWDVSNRRNPDAGKFLFSLKLHVALRKCSRSQNGTSGKHKPLQVHPGANTELQVGLPPPFLSLRFSSFALGKWPGACQAAPGSGRGRRPRGTFLCRARDNAGRAPHSRGSGRQARRPGPSPRAGREAPPRRAPSPAPLQGPPLQSWRRGDTPHRAASSGPAEPGRASRTRPSPGPAPSPRRRTPRCERSREPARRPVPAPLFARGTGQGAPATVGYSARPHRARPSAPQLTGTWRAAGHYSIAGSAGRSRLSGGKANCDREAPAGREARARGCPAQSARPRRRPGQARRGSRARRRKGRATMCRGGGGGGDASGSHNPARRRRARVSGNPNTSTGNRNPD